MAVGDVTFTSEWPVASGTMTTTHVGQRELILMIDDMSSASKEYYWTEDGKSSGTLMTSSVGFVWVQMTDTTNRQGMGMLGASGTMFGDQSQTDIGKIDQYFWDVTNTTSLLPVKTTVYNSGSGSSSTAGAVASSRRLVAYFMPHN